MTLSRNRLIGALIVSLALNAFLLAGLAHHHWRRAFGGPPRIEHLIEHMQHVLPPADAAIVGAAFESYRTSLAPLMALLHGAPDNVRKALLADPLDVDALRAALEQMAATRNQVEGKVFEAILEVAPKLSLQGRRALIEMERHGMGPDHGPP